MDAASMDSLTPVQIACFAIEGILVLAGIVAWIRRPRREGRGLEWDVPLTDTLTLTWAVLFGAFLGQIVGSSILQMLPAAVRGMEAVQIIVVGSFFDGGCIAAWFAVHTYVRIRGQALPSAIERPFSVSTTVRDGGIAFLLVLPVIVSVGLLWGVLLRSLNLPSVEQDIVGVFARTDSGVALAGLLILATIVAPLTEELIFRAGIFRVLRGRIGRWPAIAISSSLFALLHASWLGFAPLFCLGAVFCIAYERSRNIAVPIIAHGLFNLNSIAMIVLLPADFLK